MSGPIVVERSRGLLRITGRDPVKMIDGLATAEIGRVSASRGVYATFLTPKGRMVADARVLRDPDDDAVLLIDTAADALPALDAHLKKFVPPLFAKAADVSDQWAVIGVYGGDCDRVVAAAVEPGSDAASDAEEGGAEEGGAEEGGAEEGAGGVGLSGSVGAEEAVVAWRDGFAVRTYLTGDPGWDLFVRSARREEVLGALLEAGGRAADAEALEALRVAAGRPRWGRELTEDVIPLEAGLLERAISQSKGCYTGQEVIVRILHRGHVNRHLRRLEFSGPAPDPGTELYEEGGKKPRGTVTSALENDAGALGLGYVRREIEPPAELRVGAPDGDPVRVTALD